MSALRPQRPRARAAERPGPPCYRSSRCPFSTARCGSARGRSSRPSRRTSRRINDFEPELELESDDELRERYEALRERHLDGEPLDDLLYESFALTREAGKRALGQRHFDVQLIGGMVLHDGSIAEMKTGEGKTLTATLPSC